MLAGFLNVAANAASKAANDFAASPVGQAIDPVQQQIDSIKRDVNTKMDIYESADYAANETTCIGLYCHWLLSIIVLFECAFHYMLLGFTLVFVSVFYYVALCISCGKLSTGFCTIMSHFFKMFTMYLAFLCGIAGNIFVPWSPPLYYWRRSVKLIRPPGFEKSVHMLKPEDACCLACCCCFTSEISASWQIMRAHFGSLGCSCVCGIYCGPTLYTQGLQRLMETFRQLEEKDTFDFYQKTYSCSSLDQLISSQMGYHDQPAQGQGIPMATAQAIPLAPVMARMV